MEWVYLIEGYGTIKHYKVKTAGWAVIQLVPRQVLAPSSGLVLVRIKHSLSGCCARGAMQRMREVESAVWLRFGFGFLSCALALRCSVSSSVRITVVRSWYWSGVRNERKRPLHSVGLTVCKMMCS